MPDDHKTTNSKNLTKSISIQINNVKLILTFDILISKKQKGNPCLKKKCRSIIQKSIFEIKK